MYIHTCVDEDACDLREILHIHGSTLVQDVQTCRRLGLDLDLDLDLDLLEKRAGSREHGRVKRVYC